MADILTTDEIFFTPFEPKTKNRFVMYIEGVPAYLVKAANRPSLNQETVELPHINVTRYVKGRATWQAIEVTLYDQVVPSGAQSDKEWIRLQQE